MATIDQIMALNTELKDSFEKTVEESSKKVLNSIGVELQAIKEQQKKNCEMYDAKFEKLFEKQAALEKEINHMKDDGGDIEDMDDTRVGSKRRAISKGDRTAWQPGSATRRAASAGGPRGRNAAQEGDDFKVKVLGFQPDTRKAAAEETLIKHCAKEEGYDEAYMPGNRKDFAFIKFESDTARRRFLQKVHSDELVIKHDGHKLRFSRCRTREQAEKTKHIDKCKRAIIETIKAKYPDVPDESFKNKVETGMNDGGVAWIGETRVAEMVGSGSEKKIFTINAEKVANELRKFGWEIDGAEVVAAHRAAME
jgi:hypothetical protein